jgi:hypothetical protein
MGKVIPTTSERVVPSCQQQMPIPPAQSTISEPIKKKKRPNSTKPKKDKKDIGQNASDGVDGAKKPRRKYTKKVKIIDGTASAVTGIDGAKKTDAGIVPGKPGVTGVEVSSDLTYLIRI